MYFVQLRQNEFNKLDGEKSRIEKKIKQEQALTDHLESETERLKQTKTQKQLILKELERS